MGAAMAVNVKLRISSVKSWFTPTFSSGVGYGLEHEESGAAEARLPERRAT